jgi:hypothetical protein
MLADGTEIAPSLYASLVRLTRTLYQVRGGYGGLKNRYCGTFDDIHVDF